MVAGGHGDERSGFNDLNVRGSFPVNTTATVHLSYFDPTGLANILDSTSRLREPLLSIAGTADRSRPGPAYAFNHAPANALTRYVTVSANHLGTPTATREAVLAWLGELR